MCGCASSGRSTPLGNGPERVVITSSETVVKTAADTAQYSSYTLPNGIRIVLMHDPNAQKEAVFMNIDAGAEHDTCQGIANFLQYFMYMGSRKYPNSDEYHSFIKRYRGSTNAYTMVGGSAHYYEMPASTDAKVLNEVMDRFAQFFVCPLLLVDLVNSVIDAQEDVYKRLEEIDVKHRTHVQRCYYKPGHPERRYPLGNRHTLANIDVRSEAMEFYKKYYVAQNMVLVVHTRRTEASMKRLLAEMFSDIPKGEKVSRAIVDECPYVPEVFSKIIRVNVEETRKMSINYVLPQESMNAEVSPQACLIQLLSYEDEGSLMHLLDREDLLERLDVRFHPDIDNKRGDFVITVQLTPTGLKRCNEVISLIFAYIDMIKEQSLGLEMLKDIQKQLIDGFESYPYLNTDLFIRLGNMAKSFRSHGFTKMISGVMLMEKLDVEVVNRFNKTIGDNFFIMIFDPDFKNSISQSGQKQKILTDEWLGGEYVEEEYKRDEKMMRETRRKIGSIFLPSPGKFISKNMEIKSNGESGDDLPMLLASNSRSRLWHSMDSVFKVPVAAIGIMFKGNYRLLSVKNEILCGFYCFVMEYTLKSLLLKAREAGYDINVCLARDPYNGLMIRINGNDEKIEIVVEETMRVLTAGVEFHSDSTFDLLKNSYLRKLLDIENGHALLKIHPNFGYCMESGFYLPSELVNYIDSVGIEDIKMFPYEFFGTSRAEMLVYGNLYPDEARKIYHDVSAAIIKEYPPRDEFEFTRQRVKIPVDEKTFFYTASASGSRSCFCFYIETSALDDRREIVLTQLFDQITTKLFYGKLEKEEPSRPVAFQTTFRDSFTEMIMYIVMTNKPAQFVYRCIIEFIDEVVPKIIAEMSEETFLEHKKLVKEALMCRKDFLTEFRYLESEVSGGTYDFKSRKVGAAIVESLKKSDLVRFVEEKITRRRSICTAMISKSIYEAELKSLKDKDGDDNNLGLTLVHIDIGSVAEWRSRQKEYVELPTPVVQILHDE